METSVVPVSVVGAFVAEDANGVRYRVRVIKSDQLMSLEGEAPSGRVVKMQFEPNGRRVINLETETDLQIVEWIGPPVAEMVS